MAATPSREVLVRSATPERVANSFSSTRVTLSASRYATLFGSGLTAVGQAAPAEVGAHHHLRFGGNAAHRHPIPGAAELRDLAGLQLALGEGKHVRCALGGVGHRPGGDQRGLFQVA